jgi:hypothetical protein
VKGRRGIVCGEDDEAADRWGRSASEASARERAAGRWGWLVSERGGVRSGLARARRQAGSGPREEERGREGGKAAGLGRESAQQGEEKVFLFFFLLSNSYFPFCIFFF